MWMCQSSHADTGKHLCQSLFFNKVILLPSETLLRDSCTGIFCEFCNLLKSTYFAEYL